MTCRRNPVQVRVGEPLDNRVEEVAGAPPVEGTDGVGVAHTQADQLPVPASRLTSSTLLATSNTGLPPRRSSSATRLSSSVAPSSRRPRTARRRPPRWPARLLAHLRVEVAAPEHPASGVDEVERPAAPVALDVLAVAGDPGPLLDDGARRPTMRLSSVDLPTLGRPTMATTGARNSAPDRAPARSVGTGRRWRRSRPGGADPRARCRRGSALGQAHVGQQVTMAGGWSASTRARSSPTIRPAPPMLPPKYRLSTGTTRTSAPSQPLDQRREDAGAVRRGEDGDGGVGAADRCAAAGRRSPARRRRAVSAPVRPGGVAVDRRGRTRLRLRVALDPLRTLHLECAGHAHAVLVHGEALVGVRLRNGRSASR